MQIYAKWEASIHTGELLGRCVGVHHRDRMRFSGCCEGMKCVCGCGRQQLCLPASGVILWWNLCSWFPVDGVFARKRWNVWGEDFPWIERKRSSVPAGWNIPGSVERKKTLTTGRCFYYLLISGCEKLHLQTMVLLNRSHLCEWQAWIIEMKMLNTERIVKLELVVRSRFAFFQVADKISSSYDTFFDEEQ